jgi:hypothetical protein
MNILKDSDMNRRYVRLDIQSQGNNSAAAMSQETICETNQDYRVTNKHQTEPNFFDLTQEEMTIQP